MPPWRPFLVGDGTQGARGSRERVQLCARPRGNMVERWAVKEGSMQDILHGDYRLSVAGRDLVLSQGQDAANVGMQVWEAGVMLGKFLEHEVEIGRRSLVGKNIVELGAGTGIAGMICALLGANVVLTDLGGPVVDLMELNAARNKDQVEDAGGKVTVLPLDFNSESEAIAVVDSLPGRRVDIVLAADVMYVENIIAPLLDTMKVMDTNPGTETLIAFGFYRLSPLLEFFGQARIRYGLEKIQTTSLHPSHNSQDITIQSLRQLGSPDSKQPEQTESTAEITRIQTSIQSLQDTKARLLESLGRLEWRSSDLLGEAFFSLGKGLSQGVGGKIIEVESLSAEKAAILEKIGRLEWKCAMEVASLREICVMPLN